MRSVLVMCAALLALATARAHAGGGLLPPLKIDAGPIVVHGPDGESAVGTSLLIGIHYATIDPRPSRADFGVGYVGTFLRGPDDQHAVLDRQNHRRLESAHGGFFELSMRVDQRPHLRTWLSGRGELLETQGRGMLGVAGRVTTELWTGVAFGDAHAGGLGTLALGMYGEAGARESAEGIVRTISVGVTARVPLLFAF